MTIAQTMTAARMHTVGGEMKIETLPMPTPGDMDVLVRVKACGIVPNLHNILANWPTWFPHMPQPPLPAVFGLDPAGEIAGLGKQVHGLKVGDRVYVNPGRSCGSCRHCRRGDSISCKHYAFQGYFGFSEHAMQTFADYPIGGLSEFMVAPASAIVKIPDNMDYGQAARLGYLGTAYSALKKVNAGPGDTILVNGGTGTLGIGAIIFGLAMNVKKLLITARNMKLLEEIKALAPSRIEIFSIEDGSIADWVMAQTDGEGVDAFLDCNGPGAGHDTFRQGLLSMRRGGIAVDIGAIAGPVEIDVHRLMDRNQRLYGSAWLTTAEGQEMADMVEAGTVDLSIFETKSFPLADVNGAISGIEQRHGGFSNYVICP
ncbi:alcohol dehydrogenase [Rhizobium sophoriradicis]|uniref:alcohol dehydrogenase catalytic domain-containing protein n=1 Tax=Rhizobium sophoriradicis TaxID=1535245 RepID=UPI000BBDE13E|nr:alcohol dehydrogenase catalytic domain-containing protein [Rhizobium sophoriradicis]PCK86871.1 alcohol dehydrogenase [Rhizobium sophoriradicis]